MSKIKTILKEALDYQKKGFSVIPVGVDKKPLIQWLPYQKEKASVEQIKEWWNKYPKANIGIVTGKISGVSVLDIDPDNGGETPKGIPITLTSKTQSGGWHYYFKYEKDLHNMAGLRKGVDIRSDGGYVIAPPSIGKKGNYEWVVEEEPEDFPSFLLNETKKYSKKDWTKISTGTGKGDRNMNAAKYIGLMISKFPMVEWETIAWPTVVGWNKQNTPPLSEKELRITFDSVCGREVTKKNKSVVSPMQIDRNDDIRHLLADRFNSKKPLNNMASVCLFFENYKKYTGKIKYNSFRRQIEIEGKEFDDEMLLKIMREIQEIVIPSVKRETVHQAIQNYAFENQYDEALDWLNSLEWDGEKRLQDWLVTATGVDDDVYHRAIGANWFMGLVNRLVNPGCIFDHALVLAGDQGVGKTSLFRIIGGPWYKNFSGSLDSNDFCILLRGTAILDLDEGATLYKTGAQKVKASISLTFDEFRAPYDRTTQRHLRRFVFSMTTNDAEPLRDTTGNRRYWIADIKNKVNFKWLEDNRNQLYAEAYHYIKNKTKLLEVPLDIAQEKQELHLSQDSWQIPVQKYFRSNDDYCKGDSEFSTTVNEVFENVIDPTAEGNLTKLNKQTEMRIATILKVLGLEKKRKTIDGEKRIRWYLSDKKIEEIKEQKPEKIIKFGDF